MGNNYLNQKNGKDFLNPYNFISPLQLVPKKEYSSYRQGDGLKGKLKCKLEVLNKLFIPDLQDEYEFYKGGGGKLAIPASSLKGMLRAVLEAISSSCFAIVDEESYSYRPGFVDQQVGRITQMPSENNAGELVKLKKANVRQHKVKGYQNLEKLYVTLNKDQKDRKIVDEVIDNLSEKEQRKIEQQGKISKGGKKVYKGYLYKRGARYGGFYNKKNDKVFYQVRADDKLKSFEFTKELMDDYNYIVEQKCQDTKQSPSAEKKYKLKQGEDNRLIYFKSEGSKIKFVSDTEVPKFRYQYSPEELIANQGLGACDELENLCYACRILGMIGGKDSQVSYKGGLEFNDASNTKKELNDYYQTRGALSSPKPQQTLFYLEGSDFNDPEARIRGRKFYFHGQEFIKKIQKPREPSGDKLAPKIFRPLEKGSAFEFEIEFNNLSTKELGLLLYTINLEEGLAHKLGSAKGYGIGSVKLAIEQLLIEDVAKRYQSFELEEVVKEQSKEEIRAYIKEFKESFYEEVTEAYQEEGLELEAKSFEQLLNIRQLKSLFRYDLAKFKNKVYYPNNDQEGFKWFAKNKAALVYPEKIDFGSPLKPLEKKKKDKKKNTKKDKEQAKKESRPKYDNLFAYIKGKYGSKEANKAARIAKKNGMNDSYIRKKRREYKQYQQGG